MYPLHAVLESIQTREVLLTDISALFINRHAEDHWGN